MKRLAGVLMVIVLALSACGGRNPEPTGGEGVAALDQGDAGAATSDGDKSSGNEKDKGAKARDKNATEKKRGGQKESGDADPGEQDSAPSDTSPNTSGGKKAQQRAPQVSAAAPIPAGTHSYDTDGSTTVSGNTRRMPKTTTLTAQAPRGEEQTQIRDLRDSDGNGTVVETRLLYRKEGVYITYVKLTATFPGGFTDVRELKPAKPELIAPTGAEPGAGASFSMEGSGTRADVTIKAKRFEDIAIGGSNVRALVVDTKIEFSGAYEGQQTSTTWFWGKHVLALREAVATDVTNGPIRVQSQYQAVLTKLP